MTDTSWTANIPHKNWWWQRGWGGFCLSSELCRPYEKQGCNSLERSILLRMVSNIGFLLRSVCTAPWHPRSSVTAAQRDGQGLFQERCVLSHDTPFSKWSQQHQDTGGGLGFSQRKCQRYSLSEINLPTWSKLL